MSVSKSILSVRSALIYAAVMAGFCVTAAQGEVGYPGSDYGLGEKTALTPPAMSTSFLLRPPARREQQPARKAAKTGIFGTVAIPFSIISSRSKWQRTQMALAQRLSRVCMFEAHCTARKQAVKEAMAKLADSSFYSKLVEINSTVNRLIAYKTDVNTYGMLDYWATYGETLAKGQGDCEDYANLKLALLTKLGIPATSMSLVVLKDQRRQIFHAVLAVSTNRGHFILDNVRNEIVTDRQLPDYMPLYSFSAGRSWIHGLPRGHEMIAKMSVTDFNRIIPGEQFDAEPIPVAANLKTLSRILRPSLID